MTEAKELDPAALEATVDYVLQYGGRCRGCADEAGICPHSGLACDPDDAAKVIRYVLRAAEYGRSNGYIEALSTAPVALGAGWNTDLDAMPHALTLLFKAHDPDEPEGVVSLGIRGEEPQRLIAWSFLPSAIHPAPSRAVIDREQAANLAYRLCAETRHVTLGDSIAAALRSLPSNAPSLGEARLAEGEAVAWRYLERDW